MSRVSGLWEVVTVSDSTLKKLREGLEYTISSDRVTQAPRLNNSRHVNSNKENISKKQPMT